MKIKKFNRSLVAILLMLCFSILAFSTTVIQVSAAVTPTSNVISNGIYYIRNQRSGLYLDVYGKGTSDHTEVSKIIIMVETIKDFK